MENPKQASGDHVHPNYRSRLVAKEFREDNNTWFAGTPPLEALKILFSLGARRGSKRRFVFLDVKKAHLYAKAERDVYVDLPEGDESPGMCGKLNKSMYATRDAAQNWAAEYTGY